MRSCFPSPTPKIWGVSGLTQARSMILSQLFNSGTWTSALRRPWWYMECLQTTWKNTARTIKSMALSTFQKISTGWGTRRLQVVRIPIKLRKRRSKLWARYSTIRFQEKISPPRQGSPWLRTLLRWISKTKTISLVTQSYFVFFFINITHKICLSCI